MPAIARRGTRHAAGLGAYRWVIERGSARLHDFRRLQIRWERRTDIREAFFKLACCLITTSNSAHFVSSCKTQSSSVTAA
ncbi:hypothetical protein C1703_26750 [Streptomyces sp. Go-475]|nr:hypothetical protein C1703_26750 [Streptomyces sp. Go-475]